MLRLHCIIYEHDSSGNSHPVYDCFNLKTAQRECRNLQLNTYRGGIFFVGTKIDCRDLTRLEEFVKLVYDARELQRWYWENKDRDTMLKSIALEQHIDEWIARWEGYLREHPAYRLPNEVDQKLFETVRDWRIAWREWKAHKPKDDYKRSLKEKCQQHEAVIDNIITYRLEHWQEFCKHNSKQK